MEECIVKLRKEEVVYYQVQASLMILRSAGKYLLWNLYIYNQSQLVLHASSQTNNTHKTAVYTAIM